MTPPAGSFAADARNLMPWTRRTCVFNMQEVRQAPTTRSPAARPGDMHPTPIQEQQEPQRVSCTAGVRKAHMDQLWVAKARVRTDP